MPYLVCQQNSNKEDHEGSHISFQAFLAEGCRCCLGGWPQARDVSIAIHCIKAQRPPVKQPPKIVKLHATRMHATDSYNNRQGTLSWCCRWGCNDVEDWRNALGALDAGARVSADKTRLGRDMQDAKQLPSDIQPSLAHRYFVSLVCEYGHLIFVRERLSEISP